MPLNINPKLGYLKLIYSKVNFLKVIFALKFCLQLLLFT